MRQVTCTFISPEMHCSACEMVVERTLMTQGDVRRVTADASRSTVRVEGDFHEDPGELARRFSSLLLSKGYSLALPGGRAAAPARAGIRQLIPAVLLASAIVGGFFALQRTGLVDLYDPQRMNLAASFIIGIIASLSTCMALVGGLLLSISASSSRSQPSSLGGRSPSLLSSRSA